MSWKLTTFAWEISSNLQIFCLSTAGRTREKKYWTERTGCECMWKLLWTVSSTVQKKHGKEDALLVNCSSKKHQTTWRLLQISSTWTSWWTDAPSFESSWGPLTIKEMWRTRPIGFILWSRPLKTNLIVTWPFSRQNQEFLKIQSSIKIRVKL